jgi:hypothetical protein
MELTSQFLEHLLSVYGDTGSGPATPSRPHLVRSARQHRLLPTLVSAWTAEGRRVDGALVAEARSHQARVLRYHRIEAFVTDDLRVPATVHKGRLIAAQFPDGWLRATTDLDLQVPGLEEVVAVGLALEAKGWTVTRVTVFRDVADLHLALDIVDMRRPDGSGVCDLVQVQSCAYLGAPWSVPPMGHCPQLTGLDAVPRSLVELAAAVGRRRVLGRDVLDCLLLRERVDSAPLHPAMARLELWPEWRALGTALARAWPDSPYGWPDEPREIVRRRHKRLRQLRAATPGSLFRSGHAVCGAPVRGSARTPVFTVEIASDDAVSFSGPLGSGPLRVPDAGDTARMGWADE